MKKIISILLVVLTLFSFATVAFAEGETAKKTYTVTFVYSTKDKEEVKTIPVEYGTDLDTVAPKVESYVHPSDNKILVKFECWTTDFPGLNDQEFYDLPTLEEVDGNVDGIRFEAKVKYLENNLQNNVEDKFDETLDNLGVPDVTETFANFGEFFTKIVDLLKMWFTQFVFFLTSFSK